MPEGRRPGGAWKIAGQETGEALGLLILAADVLGLPVTRAVLADALRRLDETAAPAPPQSSPR